MPKQKSTHCKRDHLFKNEIWFIDINGKRQRKCRICENLRKSEKRKLKYKENEEFRNKQKFRARKNKALRCHALQDQNQQKPNPVS